MKRKIIPAAHFHFLNPFYDILCELFGFGRRMRKQIIPLMNIRGTVLDAGCGTGSLAIDVKQTHARATVTGIDADQSILDFARKKAEKQGVMIPFRQCFLQKLPFSDRTFDVVYSSFVFHHLTSQDKRKALIEIKRVLKKNGIFYLIDIGRPSNFFNAFFPFFAACIEKGKENRSGALFRMVQETFRITRVKKRLAHSVEVIEARK